MYGSLFELFYRSVSGKETDAVTLFCEFLSESVKDLHIFHELLKHTPLFILYDDRVKDAIFQELLGVLKESFAEKKSTLSLCIPTFELVNGWPRVIKTKKIIPKRFGGSDDQIIFDFTVSSEDLYNHCKWRNEHTKDFKKSAFFDNISIDLWYSGIHEFGFDPNDLKDEKYYNAYDGRLSFYCCLEILDPRFKGSSEESKKHILRCYLDLHALDLIKGISINKIESEDSTTLFETMISFDIAHLSRYFASIMFISDIKRCFYAHKAEQINSRFSEVNELPYFRNIWYDDVEIIRIASSLFGEKNVSLTDAPAEVEVFSKSFVSTGKRLNVAIETCINSDVSEHVNIFSRVHGETNVGDCTFSQLKDDIFESRCAYECGVENTLTDDGYFIFFDRLCHGNYGWYGRDGKECDLRHFPRILHVHLLPNGITSAMESDFSMLSQSDMSVGYIDYLKLRFKYCFSETTAFNKIAYEFGYCEEKETLIALSYRIDAIRQMLFRDFYGTHQTSCDYFLKDLDDVERCRTVFDRSTLNFVTLRNVGMKDTKIRRIESLNTTYKAKRFRCGYVDNEEGTRGIGPIVSKGSYRILKSSSHINEVESCAISLRNILDGVPNHVKYYPSCERIGMGYSPYYGHLLYAPSVLETWNPIVEYPYQLWDQWNDVLKCVRSNDTEEVIRLIARLTQQQYDNFLSETIELSDIFIQERKKLRELYTVLKKMDQEFVGMSYSKTDVFSDASHACALPVIKGEYWDFCELKCAQCHVYDIVLEGTMKRISVSAPRYDPEKTYVGCCGYISMCNYFQYGMMWEYRSKKHEITCREFEKKEKFHVDLLCRLNTLSEQKVATVDVSKDPRRKKLKHFLTRGGVKHSFAYDLDTFDTSCRYGYLPTVDFDSSISYAAINDMLGLPRVLRGRGDRHRNNDACHFEKTSTQEGDFFSILNRIDGWLSVAKMKWRKDFCRIKESVVNSVITTQRIDISSVPNDIFARYIRTGFTAVLTTVSVSDVLNPYVKTLTLVEEVDKDDTIEYPINVRKDWCFSRKYYASRSVACKFTQDKTYTETQNVTQVTNEPTLFARYHYRISKNSIENLFLRIPDKDPNRTLVDAVLWSSGSRSSRVCHMNSKLFEKLYPSYRKEKNRLSIDDVVYSFIEDFIFKYYNKDYLDNRIAAFCRVFSNDSILSGDVRPISTLSQLSIYNGLKSVFYDWVFSCTMLQIAVNLKYERLLEGCLYFDKKETTVTFFKRPSIIDGWHTIHRVYMLDFFLGISNVVGPIMYHYNKRLEEELNVSSIIKRKTDISLFENSLASNTIETKRSRRCDDRCNCLDCACGAVKALSDHGGTYKCVVHRGDNVPSIFDYAFGVRRQMVVLDNIRDNNKIFLMLDNTTKLDISFTSVDSIVHDDGNENATNFKERIKNLRQSHTGNIDLSKIFSNVAGITHSIYKHAIQCCEISQQKKIHDVVKHRRDNVHAVVGLKISVVLRETLHSSTQKLYRLTDYVYLDRRIGNYFLDSDILEAETDKLEHCLYDVGFTKEKIFEIFGYDKIRKSLKDMTSQILSFFYNLPCNGLIEHVSPYVADMSCSVISTDTVYENNNIRDSCEYIDVVYESQNMEISNKKPIWGSLPLFAIVYRVYANMKSLLDRVFDESHNFLFTDAKYTSYTKLKFALSVCARLGRINLSKDTDDMAKNSFQGPFIVNAVDEGDKRVNTWYTSCDDALCVAGRALYEEMGEWSFRFYDYFTNPDTLVDDDDGEDSRKLRKKSRFDRKNKNEKQQYCDDVEDIWCNDFGKRSYSEMDLVNAFYAIATLEFISSQKDMKDTQLVRYESNEGKRKYKETPRLFLHAPTNVAWYDLANMYCVGKEITETDEHIDILDDLNEFI